MISALCLLLSASMAFTPAPGEHLMAEMILTEVSEHGAIARSDTPAAPGQCRRYQVNTFSRVAQPYALAAYPDAALLLPDAHAAREDSGRSVGACWDMPEAAAGNAFVEVMRYDHDRDRTDRENRDAARTFLTHVRAGDFVQMLARYNSGARGTHTVLITEPYDGRDGLLCWVDSNFANTLIGGVRHGYVRAYQQWPIDEVADWLAADRGNGATIYRLREDIVRRTDGPGY